MKIVAFAALILAFCIQLLWAISTAKTIPHDLNFWYDWFVLTGFAVIAISRGSATWATAIVRIAIGIDFLATTLDRYGVFGPYGTKGVNWGDFSHFIAYTHQVNAFLPVSWAPFLAYTANVCEIALTITLLLGIGTRIACIAASLLLLAYGTAMTLSMGFSSQFPYAVFLLCAGSCYMATIDASAFSIDRLVSLIVKQRSIRSTI